MPKFISCLVTFFTCIALWANVELTAPADKSTVVVLTPKQQAFFALAPAERGKQSLDPAIRAKWQQTTCRVRPVSFSWKNVPENAKITLHLTGDGKSENFAVTGSTFQLYNLKVGIPYQWYITVDGQRSPEWSFTVDASTPRIFWFDNFQTKQKQDSFTNVRDLGGKKGYQGKTIRQGMAIRGFGFNTQSPDRIKTPGKMRISPQGLAEFAKLGVKTDLDLRNKGEVAGMTGSPLGDQVQWKQPGSNSYVLLQPYMRKNFAGIFRVFTDPANYPIYFHCDGGRDRTGTLAFLLLGALGADDETIETDWQASFLVFTDLKQKLFNGMVNDLKQAYGADKSMSELALAYLADIGITEAEIQSFRSIMLE